MDSCGFLLDFWLFSRADFCIHYQRFLRAKVRTRNESTFSSFSLFLVCAARTLYFFKIISSPSFQKNQGNIFSWRKKRRTWLEKGVFNCVHSRWIVTTFYPVFSVSISPLKRCFFLTLFCWFSAKFFGSVEKVFRLREEGFLASGKKVFSLPGKAFSKPKSNNDFKKPHILRKRKQELGI